MKNYLKVGLSLALSLPFLSCSTVTIKDKDARSSKLNSTPTFETSKPYFLLGLIGEHHFDVNQICQGKGVNQIQAQSTFTDGFLAAITLGIYTPRTAKIWCKAE